MGFAGAKPMTLDVWNDPGVVSLLGEIKQLATRRKVDEFFWLKAIAGDQAPGAPFRNLTFFNAADPPDEAKSAAEIYRVANIVLQGGGVLGIAHAGFVTGLETI